jgi:hypothetical protein
MKFLIFILIVVSANIVLISSQTCAEIGKNDLMQTGFGNFVSPDVDNLRKFCV